MGKIYEVCIVTEIEFPKEAGTISLNRFTAEIQGGSHLSHLITTCQQAKNLKFPIGKGLNRGKMPPLV